MTSRFAGRASAILIALASSFFVGCANNSVDYDNSKGKPSVYQDTNQAGPVQGVGIESQDINAMADQMVRDIMSSGLFSGRATPPRVVIDNEYFKNESSSIVNTKRITLRLRALLNRAARGKIIFIGRQDSVAMVEKERELKRSGMVDSGSIRSTKATAGADYRLMGTITSGDISNSSQMAVRETEIFFQMYDLEYNSIVWENFYDMKKAAQDDIMYR
ncbi:Protein of unknown function (DUF3897) [Spongiibacter sp. IMCC21906]|uniref:membrane protein n=1 Tax=Spongiibacter sp. IMCC21906 TaxID=1620392 RepID=UPI00062DCB6C|nr:membrane protein [Spongiibacter sp. IMCC21906]AKH70751.1 Protein of unknown function (DUF3897) [Spongiibacter sp. IMCC21906]